MLLKDRVTWRSVLADSSGPLVMARSSSVHGPDASGTLCGAVPGVVVTVTITGAAGAAREAEVVHPTRPRALRPLPLRSKPVPQARPTGRTAGEQNNRQQGQRDQLHVQLLQVLGPGGPDIERMRRTDSLGRPPSRVDSDMTGPFGAPQCQSEWYVRARSL